MAPNPRWTVPVNMRAQDKPTLDAALEIAKHEGSDITAIFRKALEEFVKTRSTETTLKLDAFCDGSELNLDRIYDHVLTRAELREWPESLLLRAARQVRSKKDELDAELRQRGYLFRW